MYSVSGNTQTMRPAEKTLSPFDAHASLSEAKTRQIAIGFFALLSFTVGTIGFSVGAPIPLLLGLVSYISTGFLIWTIVKIRDYSDISEVRLYREEAKDKTLDEIVEKHGWTNMCQYEIPLANEFQKKFLRAIDKMTLKQTLEYYNEIWAVLRNQQSKFELPQMQEILKEKYQNETGQLSSCDILESYPIQDLYDKGVITKEFQQAATRLRKAKATLEKTSREVEGNALSNCTIALTEFKQALDETAAHTPEQTAWLKRLQREIEYLSSAPLQVWFARNVAILTNPENGEPIDNFLALITAQKSLIGAVEEARQSIAEANQRAQKEYQTVVEGINREFQ